ncbi:transposable element Tcb2 transposase [Trichonephila clavipes]|nr:transposable element Tcb2 transposase [Trichonephila clavipes]
MQRYCASRISSRGRLTSFSLEYKTGNQSLFECAESLTREELRQISHYANFEENMSNYRSLRVGEAGWSASPLIDASIWTGATHEESGEQFMLSDDSRFNFNSNNNRVRGWRPRGEHALILLLFTTTYRTYSWCDGMGCHRLQYMPARSPDLSPIDHIWNDLGRRVGHSTSLNELETRAQQIWNEMSQDIIQN